MRGTSLNTSGDTNTVSDVARDGIPLTLDLAG